MGHAVPTEKSGEKRRPRMAFERWTIAPRANRMLNDTPNEKKNSAFSTYRRTFGGKLE